MVSAGWLVDMQIGRQAGRQVGRQACKKGKNTKRFYQISNVIFCK
jgi:hypothetical protein